MRMISLLRVQLAGLLALVLPLLRSEALEPLPDKLVVLTFDDSVASHYSVVRPILKRFGFGATFFITEGFSFKTNKQDYLTWEQIAELHRDGFEIGNHTRDHLGVSRETLGQLREQLETINVRCAEYGIPRPTSFAYPGNRLEIEALPILKELGIRFARRGGAPEHPYEWGRGFAYEPGRDHPLLIPSAGDARPDWTLAEFRRAVDQARSGKIAVIQFHGVPDRDHPWVDTRPDRFAEYMLYLQTNRCQVVAMRELARYVDPAVSPHGPFAVIEERQGSRAEVLVQGEILDATSGKPLPARLSVQAADGTWHFPKSAFPSGSAMRYERRSGFNTNSVEMHTTLSADPFRIELTPGLYTFTVERGKEVFPEIREVKVERGMARLTFRLRRWVNMAELGWFSGDTHVHQNPDELANSILAEDLNVALPMVDWTTVSTVSPIGSDRSFRGELTSTVIRVDATHVWYPRNTEYEIFKVGSMDHTLGAFLILNHRTRFWHGVFPLQEIATKVRSEGGLIDLEKHNWPWSMALIPLLKVDLFELANNHHWRTDYSITNWAVPAPRWMGLTGTGTDLERDWTLYGFQAYYALLNCGFRLRPTAGTANGVHPVPLGFSRVYVHLDRPFSYEAWMEGLGRGRSFVTTGPMMFAKMNGEWPGSILTATERANNYRLECVVQSEQSLESVELVVNGAVAQRFAPQNGRTGTGSLETSISTTFAPTNSSWIAWRCFEKRGNGRFRFAHTAPSYLELPGKPLHPRRAEAEWLVTRVKEEIARSTGVVPAELIADYQRSLAIYEDIAKKAE